MLDHRYSGRGIFQLRPEIYSQPPDAEHMRRIAFWSVPTERSRVTPRRAPVVPDQARCPYRLDLAPVHTLEPTMTANGLTPPATGTPPPQTWPFTPNVAVASRALALGFLVMSMALLTASIAVLALFEDIALKHYLIATAFMIMGVVMAVAASRVYTLLIKGRGRRRA